MVFKCSNIQSNCDFECLCLNCVFEYLGNNKPFEYRTIYFTKTNNSQGPWQFWSYITDMF